MQSRNASGLLIAALLTGCGSSVTRGVDEDREASSPTFVALPDMPFTVEPGAATRLDFEVAENGYLIASMDWQDPANNLIAVVTGRGCHSVNDALSGRCRTSEVSGFASTCPAKPRIVTHANYAPVALRLWIANTGTTAESGTVALTHCRSDPNCGATGSCMQCSTEALRRRSCAP